MKKLFTPLAFIAVIGIQAQTTIVEEKFEKDNYFIDYNFLPNSNKIVAQKGAYARTTTINSLGYAKKIHSIIEYNSNAERKILLENAEVTDCFFSKTESVFRGEDFKVFPSGFKSKFYSTKKNSDYFEYNKIDKYKFSDNYGFYISNKNGKIAEKLDDNNLNLEVLNIHNNTTKSLNIELPNLSRLQGENLLKQVVSSRAIIKTYGIGYKLEILDNEHFEIVTKGIDKDYKSMTLYRTIYNIQGKKVQDLMYTIDLKGLYLVNSDNKGGDINISGEDGSISFSDDLSINNFIIDKNTNDIFVYGLFGKESIKAPSGYYIFKFSEKGEKIYESINYINNKAFQEEIFKPYLSNTLTITGNKLLFVAGRTNVAYKRFYNHSYSFLDLDTGKEMNSKVVEYDRENREKLNGSYKEDIVHTNKELNNKILDINAYVLYDYNPLIKKYINSVNSKNRLIFSCDISNEGIWLIETDNKEYYKVTYFEHN